MGSPSLPHTRKQEVGPALDSRPAICKQGAGHSWACSHLSTAEGPAQVPHPHRCQGQCRAHPHQSGGGVPAPHHGPRALWLSGPRSSHGCSRGAFCSPGRLPAERVLRKHKVPGAGPCSPPQASHRSLLNATARGRLRRPEGGSRCLGRPPGSFHKPALQPLWSLTSPQGLPPTCPHRPSRSPGSLAGMTPAAPQSAVSGGPALTPKGHCLHHSAPVCTGQLVPPCPRAGGFLWGSPKLRGFGSCVGTRGLELWALCPKHLQGHSRAQAAGLGQAEPSALSGTRLSPPAPRLALSGPWPSLSSSARP